MAIATRMELQEARLKADSLDTDQLGDAITP